MTISNKTECPRWINHALLQESAKIAADPSDHPERRKVAEAFIALPPHEKLAFFSFIAGAIHNEPHLMLRSVRL